MASLLQLISSKEQATLDVSGFTPPILSRIHCSQAFTPPISCSTPRKRLLMRSTNGLYVKSKGPCSCLMYQPHLIALLLGTLTSPGNQDITLAQCSTHLSVYSCQTPFWFFFIALDIGEGQGSVCKLSLFSCYTCSLGGFIQLHGFLNSRYVL